MKSARTIRRCNTLFPDSRKAHRRCLLAIATSGFSSNVISCAFICILPVCSPCNDPELQCRRYAFGNALQHRTNHRSSVDFDCKQRQVERGCGLGLCPEHVD